MHSGATAGRPYGNLTIFPYFAKINFIDGRKREMDGVLCVEKG
jgi:hypothetical protein